MRSEDEDRFILQILKASLLAQNREGGQEHEKRTSQGRAHASLTYKCKDLIKRF
jgi:hypothetical protein